MADDPGARPSPEIPLPIRVIRSGKIVVQVGSLAALVTLAGVLLATGIRAWGRLPPVVRRHLTAGIGLTVVINLAIGLFIPNIDNACHIGGLAAGLVMGSLLPFSPTTETFLRPAGDRKWPVPS